MRKINLQTSVLSLLCGQEGMTLDFWTGKLNYVKTSGLVEFLLKDHLSKRLHTSSVNNEKAKVFIGEHRVQVKGD